jgi:cytochrome c553
MRTAVFIAFSCLAFISLISFSWADGAAIARHGNKHGSPMCTSCHGEQGEGMPTKGIPKLAGLNAVYLQSQLDAFADGQRVSEIMTPIARILESNERVALANYYATLKSSIKTAAPGAAINANGELLATKGRWSQGLPACMQCHGSQGVGVGTVFPALAGQSSVYMENQLRGWQEGTRSLGPLGLMKVVASKLSAADIQAVAEYFSSLPAGDPASAQASSAKNTP